MQIQLAQDDVVYRYNGVNSHGTRISGEIKAPNEAAARAELERYYDTVSIFPVGLGKAAQMRAGGKMVKMSGEDDLDSDKRRLKRLEQEIDTEQDFHERPYEDAARLKRSIRQQQGHDMQHAQDDPRYSEYSPVSAEEAQTLANTIGREVIVFSNGRVAPVGSPVAVQAAAAGATILKKVKPGSHDADPKSFWTYQAASETPKLEEAIRIGAISANTTQEQWEQFSPGMRRELVRSIKSKKPSHDAEREHETDLVEYKGQPTVKPMAAHAPSPKSSRAERSELGSKHSSSKAQDLERPGGAVMTVGWNSPEYKRLKAAGWTIARSEFMHDPYGGHNAIIMKAPSGGVIEGGVYGGQFRRADSAMDKQPFVFACDRQLCQGRIVNSLHGYVIIQGMGVDSGAWFMRNALVTRKFDTQRDVEDYVTELAQDASNDFYQKAGKAFKSGDRVEIIGPMGKGKKTTVKAVLSNGQVLTDEGTYWGTELKLAQDGVLDTLKQKLQAVKRKLQELNRLSPAERANMRKAVEEYEAQKDRLEAQLAGQDDAIATDPPVSEAQRKAMGAAKSGHSTLGIPSSVGKEFIDADPGGKLPKKAK